MNTEELLQDFVDEAKAHIDSIETIFLDIDSFKNSKESINDVFRDIHSIKGTAGFFQLNAIVSLSHAMENVLGKVRSGVITMTDDIIDSLLSSLDVLKNMVFNVETSEKTNISGCLYQLEALLRQGGQPTHEERAAFDAAKIPASATQEAPVKSIEVRENNFPLAALPSSTDVDKKFNYLLAGLVKKGHKIFKVIIPYENGIPEHIRNFDKFIENIREIGEMIDVSAESAATHNPDDIARFLMNYDGDGQIRVEILLTSVLEPELLCEALEISPSWVSLVPHENIVKINDDDRINAVKLVNSSKKSESVRVNLKLLESLMSISGEMVLARNRLLTAFKNNYDRDMMGGIIQNIDNLTSRMQREMMLTRMQPVSNLFGKFPRIVREMSKNLNKEISIRVEDGNVELDKNMIEALSDPLIHLVRNAADHGIESSDYREKIGKPGKGTITLKAYHKSSYVMIQVTDDGAGVDFEEIKRKAVEKGFLTPEQAGGMSDADARKILFYPGFSNAKAVSDISGRGVGMDVVKKNIEKMGGTVDIATKKGAGTTMTLVLPRTLAIVRSLVVEAGTHRFIIPQANVSHVIDLERNRGEAKIERIQNAKEFRFRGKLLPVVNLAELLGTGGGKYTNKVMIVMNVLNNQFGLLAGSVFDTEETLVKPVPSYLESCIAYSGAAIMGDGMISMILDPEGILKMADIHFDDEQENMDKDDENAVLESQSMMFFRCSGPELYALDMNMVSRVELINVSDIQKIGGESYINLKNKTIKIIRPEDYLPVTKNDYENKNLTLIIPALVSNPIGILVGNIVDNVKAHFVLDTERIKSPGIFGTVTYNDSIALIINIYELFETADPTNYPPAKSETAISKNVLIVEDTPFFQHVETQYLEGMGCTVTIAKNGMEALEILKSGKFDAIVSDIIMPVMDGLEFIKHVREDSRLKNLPAVAVTSMRAEISSDKALEYGFDAYEVKFNKETLIKTICDVIQSRKGGAAK